MQCFFSYSEKRALLIGVGHYPHNSGWQEISSDHDIDLLKRMLSTYDLHELLDKNATHENIKKAFASLQNRIHTGDTVLIHFSCHGQQMLPLNDSEEIDKLDEALVPYDANSTQSNKYDGRNHLRDDEMNKLLYSLRKKAGAKGLVLLTIDACFSDSMNKGIQRNKKQDKYRGGANIFGADAISKDSLEVLLTHRTKEEPEISLKKQGLADILILSACKSFQRNKEVVIDGIGYGSLSYAMYSSYKVFGISDLYKWLNGIYDQMQKIAFTQTPQIRTTLNYSFPIKQNPTIAHPIESEEYTNAYPIQIIAIIASIVVILILVLIWLNLKNK